MAEPAIKQVNLDLLIKLLKMTSSSNDGEALTAMRKANEQLIRTGGDWEKLLRGKVTVMADPFAHVPAPPPPSSTPSFGRGSVPPRRPTPPPNMYQAYTAPPPPPPRPQAPRRGQQPNKYDGYCYCCGIFVGALKGFINQHGGRWEVLCASDGRSTAPMPAKRARKVRPSTSDIFNSI